MGVLFYSIDILVNTAWSWFTYSVWEVLVCIVSINEIVISCNLE